MSEEVIVITPELTPGVGGLADYTLRIAAEWNFPRVRYLVPEPADAPDAEALGDNAAAFRKKLPARGGKVLLQYSAYGFDRWGYPGWLLRALVEWKRASGGRLVLMLHETWAFWPWWNKNYPIQQLHRRALVRLVRAADAIFTTTEKQAAQLQSMGPARPVRVLPVGSSIRPLEGPRPRREPGLAVVFGRQATRLRTLRVMAKELKALAGAGRITKLIAVGEGVSFIAAERALLEALPLRDGFEERGRQRDEAISALLWSASFGLSELDQFNIPKSSVFMAFAAHGVNVISPLAGAEQPAPLCWATHPDELQRGLSAEELAARSAKLRAWEESTASWSRAATAFAEALQISEANSGA